MLFSPFRSNIIPQSPFPSVDGGMPNPLSSHDAIVNSLMALGKSGDPENPKGKPVYKTQAEVDAANNFAHDFDKRHNNLFANTSWVAQKPGDPVVQFRPLDGKPFVPNQMPASMINGSVPDWVKELHWDNDWQMPYYLDGNDMKFVKKEFYNSPRFIKPTK